MALRWPPGHYFYCAVPKPFRALLEPDGRSPLAVVSSTGARVDALMKLKRLLRGRRVLFLGESQIMQMWFAAMCLLGADLSEVTPDSFGAGRRAGYVDMQPCPSGTTGRHGCHLEHPYFPGLKSFGLIFTCVRLTPSGAHSRKGGDGYSVGGGEGGDEGELCYIRQNIGDKGCKLCGPGGPYRGVALARLFNRLTSPVGFTALENQTQVRRARAAFSGGDGDENQNQRARRVMVGVWGWQHT